MSDVADGQTTTADPPRTRESLISLEYPGRAVSGAHLNPAVTLGFTLRGDFPWRRVPGLAAARGERDQRVQTAKAQSSTSAE